MASPAVPAALLATTESDIRNQMTIVGGLRAACQQHEQAWLNAANDGQEGKLEAYIRWEHAKEQLKAEREMLCPLLKEKETSSENQSSDEASIHLCENEAAQSLFHSFQLSLEFHTHLPVQQHATMMTLPLGRLVYTYDQKCTVHDWCVTSNVRCMIVHPNSSADLCAGITLLQRLQMPGTLLAVSRPRRKTAQTVPSKGGRSVLQACRWDGLEEEAMTTMAKVRGPLEHVRVAPDSFTQTLGHPEVTSETGLYLALEITLLALVNKALQALGHRIVVTCNTGWSSTPLQKTSYSDRPLPDFKAIRCTA